MKFCASLLLLATSALANQLQERGYYEGGDEGGDHDYGYGETTTVVTYTTVTTCPVTSTYTKEGSTYCVTDLTTSTIVVTECHGCGVTTVQGHNYTKTYQETDYVTRTTVCPVTETKTVGGKEVTVVYTTTSIIQEYAHTTNYEEVTAPGNTEYETEVEYTTRTTVCPVTVTTTKEGKPTTYVYTTTSVIEEAVHTTNYEEVTKAGPTEYETEVEYTTRTTVCPVTVTTTKEGKPTTYVYTTTSLIEEAVKTTNYEAVTKPGPTEYETEVEYTTRTTVCPVTVTTTLKGKPTTYVYTTTSVIEEAVKTTNYEHVTKPGPTEYETEVEYTTRTTVCPVTETKTIEGKETTIVYTTTSTIEEAVKTTVYEKVQQPGKTKTEKAVAYVTQTSLCPVTETLTVSGEVVTKVYTSTQYLVTQAKTTINEYQTIYQTASKAEVYTQYSKVLVTVGGGTVVETIVPKTTVKAPQTEVVTKPAVTYTTSAGTPTAAAPTQVVTGAADAKRPAFALMAGLAGALALL